MEFLGASFFLSLMFFFRFFGGFFRVYRCRHLAVVVVRDGRGCRRFCLCGLRIRRTSFRCWIRSRIRLQGHFGYDRLCCLFRVHGRFREGGCSRWRRCRRRKLELRWFYWMILVGPWRLPFCPLTLTLMLETLCVLDSTVRVQSKWGK